MTVERLSRDIAKNMLEEVPVGSVYRAANHSQEVYMEFVMLRVDDYKELREALDGRVVPVWEPPSLILGG